MFMQSEAPSIQAVAEIADTEWMIQTLCYVEDGKGCFALLAKQAKRNYWAQRHKLVFRESRESKVPFAPQSE